MNEISNSDRYLEKLLAEKTDNLKELTCLNQINAILSNGGNLDKTLKSIAFQISKAMKYPEAAEVSIYYLGKEFKSSSFNKTKWLLTCEFICIDEQKGKLDVYYTKQLPEAEIGPFLNREKRMVDNIAGLIVEYLNGIKAREIIETSKANGKFPSGNSNKITRQLTTQKLLQKFLDKHNSERNLFHDLMPFKVKEILLVATLYDAYIIEGEGRFSDHILGEYNQMNLTSMPRVTGVSSEQEALKRLSKKHFDIIIIMVGVSKKASIRLGQKIEKDFPYIPNYFILNNSSDVPYFLKNSTISKIPENLFVWNGDSKVFFTMVKLLEDLVNAANDVKLGITKVILLVEDSPVFYSKYLSILYSLVLEQTQHLIEDVGSDDMYKVLRLRARPKILHAKTYEDAQAIINEFGDNLLCVISDIRFPRKDVLTDNAGFDLISEVKKKYENLPVVLQSSDPQNRKRSEGLNAHFMYKDSDSLVQELKYFINYYLGFGHFVYRDNRGRKIAVARSMKEFEASLETIPEDSLVYHAMKNHFSMWLMARGEVKIAKAISPLKISDFKNLNEMRELIIQIIKRRRLEKSRGMIVGFDEASILDEHNIVNMGSGSLGGKGRGLAFISTLIYNFNLSNLIPDIKIRTPITVIIGTDEFDQFLEDNQLFDVIINEKDYNVIQKHFLAGRLSFDLRNKLRIFLKLIETPIAIRSSSLLEDSVNQPFSGIFNTFLLPNNNDSFKTRLRQAENAIKMVYASIYSDSARDYLKAVNYKSEDEKMAIIIQEVVGHRYGDHFYPHISGTAQSHNFYPYAHMKPEEGFALAALGLGHYVVEGERAFRFSPVYPGLEINTPKYLLKNSQVWFYAVDLSLEKIDFRKGDLAGLSKLDISDAEKDGTLKHMASVYNRDNDILNPGLDTSGPRVINLANILKYNYIPLAQTINIILDIVKEALGTPVEIEYAVDLNKDDEGKASFYLLQVKPLLGAETDFRVDLEAIDKKKIILSAEKSMGNGRIQDIKDVIYVEPDKFNKLKTTEMAEEIGYLNAKMIKSNRNYILMGPGRWGTRDKFIGIPVVWPQISNAKIIVEMSLKDFPLDASLGSHFFHNVISMNVGYLSVNHTSPSDFITWDILKKQKVIEGTKYFKHIRFRSNLLVQMDGKKRIAMISIK